MNVFKKIEALIFSDEAPVAATEPTAEIFKDDKLADGSTIRATPDLSVGAKVEIINEDGSLIPAYNADQPELTLADGSVISLDENSIILEIATPEAEAEVVEVEEMKESAPVAETPKVDDNQKRFEEIEGKLEVLAQSILKMAQAFEGKQTQMKAIQKENDELKTKNIELSKKAAAPAANFKKFEKPEPVNKIIKTNTLLEQIKALKDSKENN